MNPELLPYRRNVGALLINRDGLVFIGRRAKMHDRAAPAWQLPQGGIDGDETPEAAVLRELGEEVGTANATIVGQIDEWLNYDLPVALIGRSWGGRFRGQTQKWFALRFLGEDTDIRLDATEDPEFDAWRWVALKDLPALAVAFKRPVYERLARDLAVFAVAG